MTPENFNDWLAQMKRCQKAKTDGECAFLLGVSLDTMTRMKQRGSDRKTALACAALLAGVEPYEFGKRGL